MKKKYRVNFSDDLIPLEFTLTCGKLLKLELIQPVTKDSSRIYTVLKYRIIENFQFK